MSHLILIEGPDGIRKVEEGESFKLGPGERVIGAEGAVPSSAHDFRLLNNLAGYFGIALAEFIYAAAEALHIEHCPVCEMRYKILRAIKDIGLFRAIKLIYKTLRKHELSDEETKEIESSVRLAP